MSFRNTKKNESSRIHHNCRVSGDITEMQNSSEVNNEKQEWSLFDSSGLGKMAALMKSWRLKYCTTNGFLRPLQVGPDLFLYYTQTSWRTPVNKTNRFIRPLRIGPDLVLYYT